MTEHNGLPVEGYRPQSDDKIALVNHNKQLEELVLRTLDELKLKLMSSVDQRWLAIGRTDIEKGFMAVNRAVFQPGRAKLPGDGI